MNVDAMLRTHPCQIQPDVSSLTRCTEACFDCAQTCSSCADACLGEPQVGELVRCIRLNLDCADVCAATGKLLSRQTEGTGQSCARSSRPALKPARPAAPSARGTPTTWCTARSARKPAAAVRKPAGTFWGPCPLESEIEEVTR